jgi:uncharacterized protein (AIM24 family)
MSLRCRTHTIFSVQAGGALIRKELREGEVRGLSSRLAGVWGADGVSVQTLRVTSGALVAFSPTISYDVQMMKGFKNVVFGGEGLFITTLTGPGTVFLQVRETA